MLVLPHNFSSVHTTMKHRVCWSANTEVLTHIFSCPMASCGRHTQPWPHEAWASLGVASCGVGGQTPPKPKWSAAVFHPQRPRPSVSISSGSHHPPFTVVGEFIPPSSAFYPVVPPPSPEKRSTARPWMVLLKGSRDQ